MLNGINILKEIKSYVIISLGTFLYCFSWIAFLIPHGVAGGGVTGISSIIYYATGFEISYTYMIVNVGLLIAGTLIMGNAFGLKTIYAIFLASAMFKVLPEFSCITEFSDIPDTFINAMLGGSICAIGISWIFAQGGSTGGTDIVALIVSKYKEVSLGKVFLYCDLLIVGSIYFLPDKGLQDVIYGYIQMVSFSYLLDVLITGSKQSVQILIFTSKYQEMADMVSTDLRRGVTALQSMGWHSKQEGKLLVVIARKQQLAEITQAIMEVDNKAFISVCSAMSVFGNGFETVKVRKKPVTPKRGKSTNRSATSRNDVIVL